MYLNKKYVLHSVEHEVTPKADANVSNTIHQASLSSDPLAVYLLGAYRKDAGLRTGRGLRTGQGLRTGRSLRTGVRKKSGFQMI